MLGALHRVPVAAGDAIFVPAGMPHAIGEGLLIVELQEPTDLSVLLEWEGFPHRRGGRGHARARLAHRAAVRRTAPPATSARSPARRPARRSPRSCPRPPTRSSAPSGWRRT